MNSKNWERFTQRARRVLSLAQEEAERLNHSYIGSEHVLIGLLLEEGGVAGRVLRELGLEVTRVQAMVERLSGGQGTRTVSYTHLDVYKRQPCGIITTSRGCGRTWSWPTPICSRLTGIGSAWRPGRPGCSCPTAMTWFCLLYTSRCV